MTSLVLADHDTSALNAQTRNAITAAKELGAEVHVLVAGEGCGPVAEAAARISGVTKVLYADNAALAHAAPEPLAALLVQLAEGYDTLLAPATATGKSVMPRVAALLDVMQVSEVSAIQSADTFERPIYAGNAFETIRVKDAQKVLTIRSASFAPAEDGGEAPVETIGVSVKASPARFIEKTSTQSDRPDLSTARVIVSGGRALGSKENFDRYMFGLADSLGAAVGASRAAVDAGYAPNDLQVGQTGKIVAPDLYVACGISGAIQHLAGMKDAKVIVAINSDPEAPIFQIADYGLVADIFEALPELQKQVGS